ncbi:MAG: zf-HC2 domain-containing protein [Thermoguttaceae bacterium]
MTDQACHSIANLLVPYADGELPESDVQLVAAHLAECADCRDELQRLERSLELARSVWQEDVGREPVARPVVRGNNNKKRSARPMRRPRFATVRMAAMILVLAVTTNLLLAGGLGYGEIEPFDIVRVTGRITFDDGTPIPVTRITVMFESQVDPIDKKTHPRPGFAELDVRDGTFSEATTHRFSDGLIVGPHRVRAWSYDGDFNEVPLAIVPSEVEVGSGATKLEFIVRK